MKIFVTLGTQKFQFDRLLKELDKLVEENFINKNDLTVQVAYLEYVPKNFEYFEMKPQEEINEIIKNSDLVISHAGTGSMITTLNMEKRLIIVPRLRVYGEHIDNHQTELAKVFEGKFGAIVVKDIDDLKKAIKESENHEFKKWDSNNKELINSIDEEIITDFIGE